MEDTRDKLEKDLREREEKFTLLKWLDFLDYLGNKLSKEDLKFLFQGIEVMKEESKLEGRGKRKIDDLKIVDKYIDYMTKLLLEKLPDSTRIFWEKLKTNLEKIKKDIGDLK